MADLSLAGRLTNLRPLLMRAVSVGPARDGKIDMEEYETMMREFTEISAGVTALEMQARRCVHLEVR